VKAVFTHKAASIYDDKPEERYHFPETYLRPAQAAAGDFILYYEPGRTAAHDRGRYGRRAYVAVAKVTGIRPDQARRGFFYADVDPSTYVTFDRPVPFREGQHYYERQLRREGGGTSKGAFGRAVRPISDQEFTEILTAGFAAELSRDSAAQPDLILPAGLMEAAADFQRPVIERIMSRPVRDAAFRHAIQTAYESTCAMTGIKLINGGGRSEAQAAHIRPVAERGPDSIRNGLALCPARCTGCSTAASSRWAARRTIPSCSRAMRCPTACGGCSTRTCCYASPPTSASGLPPPTPSTTARRSSRAERRTSSRAAYGQRNAVSVKERSRHLFTASRSVDDEIIAATPG
jgi:putative restriction endonuclease